MPNLVVYVLVLTFANGTTDDSRVLKGERFCRQLGEFLKIAHSQYEPARKIVSFDCKKDTLK